MSVIDSQLLKYGFEWKLNPYRIEDKTGAIIQRGPVFDVSDKCLKARKETLIRRNNNQFKVS